MGYSHHWKMSNNKISSIDWNVFCNITRKLIQASQVEICDGFGENEPEINEDEICFNGSTRLDEDFETCLIDRKSCGKRSFCKTNRKPYDEVVVAVLIVGERLKILTWSSDGDDIDFEKGKKLLAYLG